jgi:hypothetical protein
MVVMKLSNSDRSGIAGRGVRRWQKLRYSQKVTPKSENPLKPIRNAALKMKYIDVKAREDSTKNLYSHQ